MQITLIQRVGLLFIQAIISFIWVFDWLNNFPQRLLYGFLKIFCVISTIIILATLIKSTLYNSRTQDFSDQITYGIVAQVYGTSYDSNFSNDNNVLGISSNTVPALIHKITFPVISAKSVLVVDESTQKVLFNLNSDAKSAPASTTKLMTALVALEIYSLDEKVTVPGFCTQIESQKVGLPENETFNVKDLLYSLLVSSAGDAACALAAGKIPANEFINLMNVRARELGMTNTFFVNPIGLDGVDSTHFSTAEDLYKLSQAAISNKVIRGIVSTKDYSIISDSTKFNTEISNTNKLLWEIPNTVGIKTGTTLEAGEVLIYEYKDELKDLVIIVMGSQDRFYDTQAILSWILKSYSW